MSRGVIIAIIIVVIVVIIIGIVIVAVVFSGDSSTPSSANVMNTGNTTAVPSMAPLTTQQPNATSVGGASTSDNTSDVVPDGYIMINTKSGIPAPPRIYCPADGYSGIEIKDGKQMCYMYKEADGKATMNWVEPVLFGA